MFFSVLVILVSISSNLFSRFLVFLHWIRTCFLSSQKFPLPHSEACFCQFIKLVLHPVLFPWRRREVLGFGDFSLFVLVSFHIHGFIYLWFFKLVTFGWSLWMDVLFVHVVAVSFCLLVFLLIVRPLCCRTADVHSRPCLPGDHLQQLQNGKGCCQFLLLLSLSQKDTCQMSVWALLYEVTLWIYRVRELFEETVCPL